MTTNSVRPVVLRGGVTYGDVEQEVVGAGDDEDADSLRESVGPVAERFDVLAGG